MVTGFVVGFGLRWLKLFEVLRKVRQLFEVSSSIFHTLRALLKQGAADSIAPRIPPGQGWCGCVVLRFGCLLVLWGLTTTRRFLMILEVWGLIFEAWGLIWGALGVTLGALGLTFRVLGTLGAHF